MKRRRGPRCPNNNHGRANAAVRYCPNCGVLIDTEYLPPGHPLTHDMEIDIEQLKAKNNVD